MNNRRPNQPRPARLHNDDALVFLLILAACLGVTYYLGNRQQEAPPQWSWETRMRVLYGILIWCGAILVPAVLIWLALAVRLLYEVTVVVPYRRRSLLRHFATFSLRWFGGAVLLVLVLPILLPCLLLFAPFWLLEQGGNLLGRYRQVRAERRLGQLRRLVEGKGPPVTDKQLRFAVKLLYSPSDGIRQQAVKTISYLVRDNPTLTAAAATYRGPIEQALRDQFGFAQALREAINPQALPGLVTLGAKIGAGTVEKRITPATRDPEVLARWLRARKGKEGPQEVQVSIGYDTGTSAPQAERGRFLALYLFIASTNLKRFQALSRLPTRDPNAAYGLLIRGDRVEVHYPGQGNGKRLDYVFPYPAQLSRKNLSEFLRQFQLLNLGMLLATVEESYRWFFPDEPPPGFTPQAQAAAQAYRQFERRFVRLLRRYDRYRDPEAIFPLNALDHRERVAAVCKYRLEECLYPRYHWVVPLYSADTSWEMLLDPLRAVEAMLLNQSPVRRKRITRGLAFIQAVRLLGYRTALAVEEALVEPEPGMRGPLLLDPFIDGEHEDGTIYYLRETTRSLRAGRLALEMLADPVTFRRAAAYYGVEEEELSPRPPTSERESHDDAGTEPS